MSLNVKATSSAENGCPSLHFTPLRSLNVQLRPSGAIVQLSARSGAGARSFPGLVMPSKIARLMKSDSTNAFGLHGFSVGSAPIGMVTVPPATGPLCADGALELAGWLAPVHADRTSVVTRTSAEIRKYIRARPNMADLPPCQRSLSPGCQTLVRRAEPPAIVHVEDRKAFEMHLET